MMHEEKSVPYSKSANLPIGGLEFCAENNGEIDKAKAIYKSILDIDPQNKFAFKHFNGGFFVWDPYVLNQVWEDESVLVFFFLQIVKNAFWMYSLKIFFIIFCNY